MDISKAKTIAQVNPREIFATPDAALTHLEAISTIMGDDQLPMYMYGYTVDEEGNLSENADEVWPEGYQAAVYILSNRQEVPSDIEGETKMGNVPQAIFLRPVPTIELLLADPQGKLMVESVIDKEVQHRAMRPLRTADNHGAVIGEVPISIAAFCASGREASGSIVASYNELWSEILTYVKGQLSRVAKAKLTKSEFKKCLENAAYANCYYEALESAGDFKLMLQLLIRQAGNVGIDSQVFENWLGSRDEQVFTAVEDDDDDVSAEDMLAAFTTPTEQPSE